MASTIKISDSLNWVQCYGGFKPLNLGTNSEPAITSANVVLQTILGPPFCWNWNRDASTKFLTTVGQQDYAQAMSTFGFIEKASFIPAASVTATSLTSNVATYTATNTFAAGEKATVTGSTNGSAFNVVYQPILTASSTQFTVAVTNADIPPAGDSATAIAGDRFEISQIINVLGDGAEPGTPSNIAPQIDDNAGNITFRVLPIPDEVYQISIIQQKKISVLISAISNTWTPIPDHYSYIYQNGYLALLMAYWDDPRWQVFSQRFVAGLLGAAEGLSEEQRNIFQAAWLNTVTEQQSRGLQTQQGVQGRGV